MTTAVASATYLMTLKSREDVAEQTMAIRLESPASFAFTPGQFIEIALLNPPESDAKGDARVFSIASAPHEGSIMVATRMRDTAFKRALKHVPLGTEVRVKGPFGNLKLHNDNSRAAVILTGGIGITPFRSILLSAAKAHRPLRIFLFYANRRPEDAAFLDELQDLEKQNPHFRMIACMSQMENSHRAWPGETGEISAQLLAKYLKGVVSPIYYITGPPAMVQAMRALLTEMGVDDDNVRIEEFAGY